MTLLKNNSIYTNKEYTLVVKLQFFKQKFASYYGTLFLHNNNAQKLLTSKNKTCPINKQLNHSLFDTK